MRLITTAILSLSFCTQLHASSPSDVQAREAHQLALFADFDQNKNGKLTEQEFVHSVIANLFQRFDLDGNGKVSKAEYFKHSKNKKTAKKEYPILDPTGKGYITLNNVLAHEAFVAELKAAFKKLDTQSKGFISLSDLPDLTPDN